MLPFKKCFSYPDHVEKYIVSCVRKVKGGFGSKLIIVFLLCLMIALYTV